MTLVPIDPRAIPMRNARHAHCKAINIVEAFMKSEHEAVELQSENMNMQVQHLFRPHTARRSRELRLTVS